MPRKKNTALRVIVPVAAIVVGLMVVYAAFRASQNTPSKRAGQNPTATAPAGTQAESPAETPAVTAAETPAETTPDQPVAQAEPEKTEPAPAAQTAASGLDLSTLRVRPVPIEPFDPIGSLEKDGPRRMRITFSRIGAGVESLRLAGSYVDVEALTQARRDPDSVAVDQHTPLQTEINEGATATPFAVQSLDVYAGAQTASIDLTYIKGRWAEVNAWRQTAPGAFEAVVTDADDSPILRVTRTYVLDDATYDLLLDQSIENLTDAPLTVKLNTFGPVDMQRESTGYGGDRRRVRFGYLPNPTINPTRQAVASGDYLMARSSALGKKEAGLYPAVRDLWPNERSVKRDYTLSWVGLTNRYYGVAVHPLPPMIAIDAGDANKSLAGVETVDRVLTDRLNGEGMALRLNGAAITVAAGAKADIDLGVYAGPLSRPVIKAEPYGVPLRLDELVVYNFGGPCALCTFSFLTDILIWLLLHLHMVTGDWALSIILLVVIVRTCLHPITKWSQIRLQVFGKQMQGMAPKQQKIKEKYGDDPKRMQQEMGKLWREEGINPAGMLGCLPMFLQTPVWIALYATLFYSIELRHNPAFFGVFQQFGGWGFLADLASPDNAIPFGRSFNIPLMGEVTGINILPILLGFVFFAHQKYLTPPSTAAMTPEQEQQQKIIRVMTVGLFPIFMYNAPSGLALYFITNSTLAIFENRHIRADAERKGLLDLDKIKARKNAKKAHKPSGGFFARLQQMAEQQQKLKEMRDQARQTGAPVAGSGKRHKMRQSKPDRPDPGKRYKKRK